jgi:hypothetical protein
MLARRRRQATRRCGVFLLVVGLVVGCGSSSSTEGRKAVHPVKGQVFVGGKAAAGAFVLFVPAREAANTPDPRPRATVQEDGTFVLSTYGDGAPEGDYLVTVTRPVNGRDDEDRLRGRYADRGRSGLKAAVRPGPNEIPAFMLK